MAPGRSYAGSMPQASIILHRKCARRPTGSLRSRIPTAVGARTAAATSSTIAGTIDHPAVARGIDYLSRMQGSNGFWDEPRYTATGFPRVFYLRYHGYSKFFPLWALARYRNLTN